MDSSSLECLNLPIMVVGEFDVVEFDICNELYEE